MNFKVPVFLVNLLDSTDRRGQATRQLDERGIDWHLVEAADGSRIDPDYFKFFVDGPESIRLIDRNLAAGEIGCMLSHLEVYRIMIEQNLSHGIVMEDDVALSPDFSNILDMLGDHLQDLDLVSLIRAPEANVKHSAFYSRQLGTGFYLSRYIFSIYGTAMYWISLSEASRVLGNSKKISLPLDTLLFDTSFSMSFPHMLYCHEDGVLKSPLGSVDENLHSTITARGRDSARSSEVGKTGFLSHGLRGIFSSLSRVLLYLPWDLKKKYIYYKYRSERLGSIKRYMRISSLVDFGLLPVLAASRCRTRLKQLRRMVGLAGGRSTRPNR